MPAMRTPDVSRRHFLQGIGGATALAVSSDGVTSAAQPASLPSAGSLTDVGGLRVGHFTDPRRPTGCTAILFDKPATAGVDYDGSAPGESLGVVLQPVSPLDQIHAIFLTGGGPMALGATAGVVRFLEERQVGYDWGVPNVRVPIVVGAVIDDLAHRRRPHSRRARRGVSSVPGGVGRPRWRKAASARARAPPSARCSWAAACAGMKGGVGTASARLGDVVVAAMVVLNAAGDIVDWRQGTIVAGARTADGRGFARSVDVLRRDLEARGAAMRRWPTSRCAPRRSPWSRPMSRSARHS